jgi:integrase
MEAGGFATNTVEDATRLLRWAHRKLPEGLPTATREELTALFADTTWSPQTRATYRQHIRRLFAWAVENDWLTFDPSTALRRPRVEPGMPHPATDEQVRTAITHLAMPWRLHARLAAYGGLRCIEVARLLREHITRDLIYVYGKGAKPAVVPCHPLVWELVRDLPAGPVTSRAGGQLATDHWVSWSTSYHLKRDLGIDVTMHGFRHWFGTNVQQTYGDARVTQQLMRHASLNSTQIYLLVTDARARAAVNGLPDVTG